jgi:hypothetical protein
VRTYLLAENVAALVAQKEVAALTLLAPTGERMAFYEAHGLIAAAIGGLHHHYCRI